MNAGWTFSVTLQVCLVLFSVVTGKEDIEFEGNPISKVYNNCFDTFTY